MRKVRKINEPAILQNNKATWTAHFYEEVKTNHGYRGMNKTVRDKYNHAQVKTALKKMYSGKCCYCENKIGEEGYENIEHLKPKSLPQFHCLTFDWSNLHWCCEKCNKRKGAKWNTHYPIVDPTKDNPLHHIDINVITGELEAKTRRGRRTINDPDLNRIELVEARKAIIYKLNEIHLMVLSTPTLKDDQHFKNLLHSFIQENIEFSSLMQSYITKWNL